MSREVTLTSLITLFVFTTSVLAATGENAEVKGFITTGWGIR